LSVQDAGGSPTQVLEPGHTYSLVLRVGGLSSNEISAVSVDLSGPSQPSDMLHTVSFRWQAGTGFSEPTDTGTLDPGACQINWIDDTHREWIFPFTVRRLSRSGTWRIEAYVEPAGIAASLDVFVEFDYLIDSDPVSQLSVTPLVISEPSRLSLRISASSDAELLVSSSAFRDDSDNIVPVSVYVDDDPYGDEASETGSDPLALDASPKAYRVIGAGQGKSIDLYVYLLCTSPEKDGRLLSGAINVGARPVNPLNDDSTPTVSEPSIKSEGKDKLVGPSDVVVVSADVSDDEAASYVLFSVWKDGMERLTKQVAWDGDGTYSQKFDLAVWPGERVYARVEAVDFVGHVASQEASSIVEEKEPSLDVYVGKLSIWENDYFDDLYDVFPSFPSDGWAHVYAQTSLPGPIVLHYERRYPGMSHLFGEGSVSMTPVSSTDIPNLWHAAIRVAPSENVTFWAEASGGRSSRKKWFLCLPNVWDDHYGFGILESWGEDDWSPEEVINRLESVDGSFVIPINTWGQSSTDPPRYFYPFENRSGLWDPEFGGDMHMTGWYEGWRRASAARDPLGSFYVTSWFFYHRTWREDSPPVPAPHTKEQWDRLTKKLGRLIGTDPTFRALILDQEYAGYDAMDEMVPLATQWDDDQDGVLESDEFERHVANDILGTLRTYRSDTWYGGQPHLGYRWSSHEIPESARLAGSVNHFQHCDANGDPSWYFTRHFDSSIYQPLLSAGVSACASDLATDYYLHRTMESHGTPTTWDLGYAEQLLYAYLLNPHYVTNWVHGGWGGSVPKDTPNSFDDAEKAFTKKIASKWNHVPYLSNMIYAELPTGGSRPFGRRQLGEKPGWLDVQPSNLYFSLSKETGSMYQLAIANFYEQPQTLTLALGPELFQEYGGGTVVALDPTDPTAPWAYLNSSSNTLSIQVGAEDMRIVKIGVPVEMLGLPQPEDGYPQAVMSKVSPPRVLAYDAVDNRVYLEVDPGVSQFVKLYLPPGKDGGQIFVNGRELDCALQVPNLDSIEKTDDVRALIGYVPATSHPPQGGSSSPKDFIEAQVKPYGGYGPFGIDQKLESSYWWNSFGVRAALLANASIPEAVPSMLLEDLSSTSDVMKIDLVVSALVSMGVSVPQETLSALQSARNENIPDRDYNNGIEWEYRRVHAITLLGATPTDRDSIVQRVIAAQDQSTGGWEAVPIGQNLESLEGFTGEKPCIWRTHHAVIILTKLGAEIPFRDKVVEFLLNSQNTDGGWGYTQGRPSDIYPTLCAVEALKAMGEQVPNRARVVNFVYSLYNSDGGFGDRPGWYSRLESTYYALKLLALLDAPIPPYPAWFDSRPDWFDDPSYHIYSATFEFYNGNYGHDSPGEAALYAEAMGLDIVAPKIGGDQIASRFNDFAQRMGLSTRSVVSSETYGFKLHVNGYHWVDHSGEEANPVGGISSAFGYVSGSTMGVSLEELVSQNAAFLSNGIAWWNSVDWKPYHLTRDVLDGVIDLGGGYNALWCQGIYGYSVPERNPWIEKYMGHLAPVTECDNHGWAYRGAMLAEKGKTLFIAKSPDWEGLLDAVKHKRTAYVNSEGQVWGDRWVVEYVKLHSDEWSLPKSPLVVALPITNENSWEWGRDLPWEVWPGSGAVIRILAEDGTTPGTPSLTEIYECRIDGVPQTLQFVSAEEIDQCYGKGAKYFHSYYYVERPDLDPGQHVLEVDYKDYDGERTTLSITFNVT